MDISYLVAWCITILVGPPFYAFMMCRSVIDEGDDCGLGLVYHLALNIRESWIDKLFRSKFEDFWRFLVTTAFALYGIGNGFQLKNYTSITMDYLMLLTVVGALSFFFAKLYKRGALFVTLNIIGLICNVSVALISSFYHIASDKYHYLFIIASIVFVALILFVKWISLPLPQDAQQATPTTINNVAQENERIDQDWAKEGIIFATGTGLGLFITDGSFSDMVQLSESTFLWLASLNIVIFTAFMAVRLLEHGSICKFLSALGLSAFMSIFLVAAGIKYIPGFEVLICSDCLLFVFAYYYWNIPVNFFVELLP